ncbi:hypothetical protein GWK47_021832 [Chionoecetes opilio]|uniref:Uncharacterized protein n=1 Tax=Chionoecetes opilio TaxID=41210 RepID=A0A8J4XNB9_CHIOP|nr:hypothetical protein GWK47_021832 [Chionoecetes opilio]
MDVLAVIDSGLVWSCYGKKFACMRPLFRTIWKTREKNKTKLAESADVSSRWFCERRDPLLEKWRNTETEQVDQRKSNVDGVAIMEKARSIYDHLAEKEPSGSSPPPGFCQSHGGVHRFKQLFSLHNIARTVRYWIMLVDTLHSTYPGPSECVRFYLPPRQLPLLQPMDMGVIKTFKCTTRGLCTEKHSRGWKRQHDDSHGLPEGSTTSDMLF